MRMRARYTEMLSMIESGRAKYTYSKMQGVWRAVGHALLGVQAARLVDEHRLARRDVAHQLEAEHVERDALGGEHVFEALAASRAEPSTSGRMPFGSRKPSTPWPITIATTA